LQMHCRSLAFVALRVNVATKLKHTADWVKMIKLMKSQQVDFDCNERGINTPFSSFYEKRNNYYRRQPPSACRDLDDILDMITPTKFSASDPSSHSIKAEHEHNDQENNEKACAESQKIYHDEKKTAEITSDDDEDDAPIIRDPEARPQGTFKDGNDDDIIFVGVVDSKSGTRVGKVDQAQIQIKKETNNCATQTENETPKAAFSERPTSKFNGNELDNIMPFLNAEETENEKTDCEVFKMVKKRTFGTYFKYKRTKLDSADIWDEWEWILKQEKPRKIWLRATEIHNENVRKRKKPVKN